ncbi:hypothetical protein N8I84_38070 [Streptomyces cynarae]|uniref:Uncharacterized protein n=1 Tax=Streptomyces cynarae TaxID=2981134 RepID=A0ABY6EE48_9ACTN|nr:hypothetical protein [Streptomyces cynarae]UXY24854.1 hypothetical protein N8I84_38070 [Streptomyces cynarae]
MWVLAPELWEDLLEEHGLIVERVDILNAPPADGSPVSCGVFHARRHTRAASRPRTGTPRGAPSLRSTMRPLLFHPLGSNGASSVGG